MKNCKKCQLPNDDNSKNCVHCGNGLDSQNEKRDFQKEMDNLRHWFKEAIEQKEFEKRQLKEKFNLEADKIEQAYKKSKES